MVDFLDLKTYPLLCLVARGLPGSGKSTVVEKLASTFDTMNMTVEVCSSDKFFICACCGKYCFIRDRLTYAHEWCQRRFRKAVKQKINRVLVDNTNCTTWECETYVSCAIKNGYHIEFLEPQTEWAFNVDELVKRNVHNVPREAIEAMLARWVHDMTVEKALAGVSCDLVTADEKAAVAARRNCDAV